MKKLISFLTCISIIFSMCMPIFAANKEETELTEIVGTADFNGAKVTISKTNDSYAHYIQFPTVQQLSVSNRGATQSFDMMIDEKAKTNIEIVSEYINEMNLSAEEKTGYLRQIQEIPTGGYLDSCTIYVADRNAEARARTYYGTYKGKAFYTEPYMELSVNLRQTTTRNLNTLNAWIQGSVDLVMAVAEVAPEISVAFAFFNLTGTLMSNGYESRAGDYAEYYARCKKHIRNIVTYDSEGYVGTDYCTVIQDALANIYPYVVYHCDPEYAGVSAVVYENPSDRLVKYSDYYNNSDYNLQRGYERYYSAPDVPLLLSSMSLSDTDITWSWK